ncbi:EamA family transporter [Plesiomonas shigelloides]|uniref:EamA family transporter n=1 Tax=Plesiomonas shigelloides TaxID=703 RepID=UPI0022471BF3|nr:EamA family transporter [Plesiomonas shigelloides]MCX2532814.1 EamA family transporter [Plesiomonas shigelloides]
MTLFQILYLFIYSIGMVVGQILFKLSAESQLKAWVSGVDYSYVGKFYNLISDVYFVSAIALYFLLSGFWVWILSFTPISSAYPFVALSFVITPLLGSFFFGETLEIKNYLSILFIFIGVFILAR